MTLAARSEGLHQQPVARASFERRRRRQFGVQRPARRAAAPPSRRQAVASASRLRNRSCSTAWRCCSTQGWSSPLQESEPCRLERGGRLGRAALPVRALERVLGSVGAGEGALEVHGGAGAEHQRPASIDRPLAQRAPQPREQRAQRLARIGGRVLRPQELDQLVARDRPLAVHGQVGEHEPALAAGRLDGAAREFDGEAPAELDPHVGHEPNLTAPACPTQVGRGRRKDQP